MSSCPWHITHYRRQYSEVWHITAAWQGLRDTPGVLITCQECTLGQGLNWKLKQVCKEQRGAPDQLSHAWVEKLFWEKSRSDMVGDESFPKLSLFSLWSCFRKNLNMEVEIKKNFWKFYWFNPHGIGRVSNVEARCPALSNVIKYFCFPLFHSQFSSLLMVLLLTN